MIRVFIAGKYSDTNVLDVLTNIRTGIQTAVDVLQLGMAPFCPWLDHQYGLVADLPMEVYKEATMAFLVACDVLLALPSFDDSPGALDEIKLATLLKIPVVHSISELKTWNYNKAMEAGKRR